MNLSSFFTDENGQLSSNRLATIGSIILFVPCFVAAWTYLSFLTGKLVDIPESVQWFLGVLLGGKIAQKGIEIIGSVLKSKIGANNEPANNPQ